MQALTAQAGQAAGREGPRAEPSCPRPSIVRSHARPHTSPSPVLYHLAGLHALIKVPGPQALISRQGTASTASHSTWQSPADPHPSRPERPAVRGMCPSGRAGVRGSSRCQEGWLVASRLSNGFGLTWLLPTVHCHRPLPGPVPQAPQVAALAKLRVRDSGG